MLPVMWENKGHVEETRVEIRHRSIDLWVCLLPPPRPRARNAVTHARRVWVGAAHSQKQPSATGSRSPKYGLGLIGCCPLAPPSLAADWPGADSSSRWLDAICRSGCVARLLLPSGSAPKVRFESFWRWEDLLLFRWKQQLKVNFDLTSEEVTDTLWK